MRGCYGNADRSLELLVGNRLLGHCRNLADRECLPVFTVVGHNRRTHWGNHLAVVVHARQYLVSCRGHRHGVLLLAQFAQALIAGHKPKQRRGYAVLAEATSDTNLVQGVHLKCDAKDYPKVLEPLPDGGADVGVRIAIPGRFPLVYFFGRQQALSDQHDRKPE